MPVAGVEPSRRGTVPREAAPGFLWEAPRAAGPEALVGTLGPRLASREQGPRAQAGGGAREGRGGDVVFEAMLSLSATEGRMSRQGFAFSLNLVLILM